MKRHLSYLAPVFCLFHLITTQQCPGDSSQRTPYSSSCLVVVSTLDGTLTALDREGSVHWVVPSLAGPLFSSSLSAVEFGDDAARLIPSLDGSIFHWVGDRLEPLPFTAESLLSPPFQLRDGTLLVGSRDILVARLYRDTGKVIYLCSASGCHLDFGESSSKSLSDVLSVRRIQQTVRAIEGRTGLERWNFTVGQYELSLSEGEGVEANTYDYVCSLGPEDWELQIMASEGVITAIHSEDRQELWSHQFSSPLSAVWSMDGPLLRSLPLFHGNTAMQSFNIEQNDQKTHPQFNPLIILAVGSHKGQLYVHSSTPAASIPRSFAAETVKRLPALVTGDPSALPTYSTRTDRVPHTTEMTVYTGEADYFPQGETMYFYSEGPKFPLLAAHSQANENDNDSQMCQKQESTEMLGLDVLEARLGTILILVAILFAIKYVRRQKVCKVQKKPLHLNLEPDDSGVEIVCRQSSAEDTLSPSRHSDSFVSMFERDFEIVGVLGRGGFGEVYDVRKPLDECSYAIKRIRLPRRSKAKERVLREVKALAKLDHPHIIRYYTSWEECPPLGFMYKQLSTEGADTIFSTSEEEITQRESTVATTSHLVSRTEGSSFIQFVDESQQTNYTHNSISDKGLVSDCTDDDIDGETSLGETERNRWSRNNSDSSPVFLYIQMELCHKHTLKDWLADNHTRDYHYVMNIFQQIVSAVAYVHTQGMMHRDLKPSNILFAVNGAVKVGDFGLVKYLAKTPSCNAAMNKETFQSELDYYDSMDNAHITSDVGTELYMSPEQVAGKPYCEKVDVFSMGVILFELLTPFTTQMERHQTLIRVRSRQFPQSFEEQYPKEHGLTCSLLAEFPDNRPSAQNIKNHSLLDPFKGH